MCVAQKMYGLYNIVCGQNIGSKISMQIFKVIKI